jgi:hypothetical protein
MSTHGTPQKPLPEIVQWLDASWGLNSEGAIVWIRDGLTKNIKAGDPVYCCLLSTGYVCCRTSTKPRRAIKAHHLVWYFAYGEWPLMQIDHIDCNRSNNSIANLRLATKIQNMQNKKNKNSQRLLPRGVNKAYKNNYFASIVAANRRIYLGYFKTAEEAGKAYKDASLKFHKEFSCFAHQEVT